MKAEDHLEVVTRWICKPDSPLVSRIVEIRGGLMPPRVREELSGAAPPDLELSDLASQKAQFLLEALGQRLPEPEPIAYGPGRKVRGVVSGLQLLEARSSDDPQYNYISAFVEYENGFSTEISHSFKLDELPEYLRALIREVHRVTNERVMSWFWSQYGDGSVAPKEWKARKREVFLSYRASGARIARLLFRGLGEYDRSKVFIPRMDEVDLQAGSWMDQLMAYIAQANVFVPVITEDYLTGPVARLELDQAMRQAFHDRTKRIIPVLVEGRPEDYQTHFLGSFHMITADARNIAITVDDVARLALDVSRNQYE